MQRAPLSRRGFATAALTATAAAQQVPSTPSEAAVQNPPLSNRLPPTGETMPFAAPLSFTPLAAPRRQTPFPLTQVRLLGGPCLEAAEANRAYMLRLQPERLLHNFLVNAGLPSAAAPFGGWESPKSELRGHFTGHYLSACALRFASAGDPELKARGEEIVAGLAGCQQRLGRDGYLSAFPHALFDRLERLEGVWAPFYTLHKILAGLLDMHQYAGSRQALEVASRLAEWAGRWTAAKPLPLMQAILREEFGGMSEVLLSLSAAAGEPAFATTADRFHKLAFLSPLAQRRDELRKLHANTHIPQVLGAARRYELSSDARFRDVAQFFFDTVVSARTYSTGGSGNYEAWLTHAGPLSVEWAAHAHHQECCCAYNMMKLARMLYSWSGDARYFDYYERNLFNHRLGGIQLSTGHSIYFLSLTPGAWKTLNTEDQTFWCCTGSALEEYSKLGDSIYSHGEDGLSVNLFIASTLDAAAPGVALRQDTKFPDEPKTTLTVTAAPASAWTLRLRIPVWSRSPRIELNGRPIEGSPGPSSYFSLHRVWKPGDRVVLHLPMRLTSKPMPDNPAIRSFLYGPLVLAADFGARGLTDALVRNHQGPQVAKLPLEAALPKLPAREPETWLQPGAEPLSFRAAGAALTLRPLARLWGRFAVYFQSALLLMMMAVFAQGAEIDVARFGAKGDGLTVNTAAIQKTIDAAARRGDTVVFSKGVYVSGALFLKSGVEFRIDEGVELHAVEDDSAYPIIPSRVGGIEMSWPAALVNVIGQSRVRIRGKGVIDGHGPFWWRKFWGDDGQGGMLKDYVARGVRWAVDYDCQRIRPILVHGSEDVLVQGLTIRRSGFWTLTFTYCRNVTADGLIIRANLGGLGPSTDGIDVDSSSHVLIENCDIECNDDNICLKAGRDYDGLRVNRPTTDVVIRNSITRAGHGMVTIGSDMSGGVRDVEVYGLRAIGTQAGIRFKSARVRGGVVRNIRFRDITMEGVHVPFEFNLDWFPAFSYPQLPASFNGKPVPPHWIAMTRAIEPPSRGIPEFHSIEIERVTATGARRAFDVRGHAEKPIRDVRWTDVTVSAAKAGSIRHAANWSATRVKVTAADGAPVALSDCANVNVR